MCSFPHLGLQGKALRGVGAQGEGETPVPPVPTSLNAVHVNKLGWRGEAPVPELSLAGCGECICSLAKGGNRFIPHLVLQGPSEGPGHWPPRRGPGDRGLEAGLPSA